MILRLNSFVISIYIFPVVSVNKSKERDIWIIDESHMDTQKSSNNINRSLAFDKWKDYSDFELVIGSGAGQEYPVTIINSPAGAAHETMYFPFDERALENTLKDIEIALLRSREKSRLSCSQEEETVKDFGKKLFDALLTGKIQSCYDVSLHDAAKQGKGLRMKLRIEPPELVALPWEFLYDSQQLEYLSLSSSTPVVRYPELVQSIRPLSVDPPLRILGMTASPSDLPLLNVEREKRNVEEAMKDLKAQKLVDITWVHGQTWEDLMRAMQTGIWHIFHFIGHGSFDRDKDEGLIALSDEDGRKFLLGATQLKRLIGINSNLRLVLLNSCEGARGSRRDIFSSASAILVHGGMPAVLAMQYSISDEAAIVFSRAFYMALADGMPVDAAVTHARIAVNVALKNSIEWGTPVLYMRSCDGVLFNIQKPGYCYMCGEPNKREDIYCIECGCKFSEIE